MCFDLNSIVEISAVVSYLNESGKMYCLFTRQEDYDKNWKR